MKKGNLGIFYGNAAKNHIRFSIPYIVLRDDLTFKKSKFIIDMNRVNDGNYVNYLIENIPYFVLGKIINEHGSHISRGHIEEVKKKFISIAKEYRPPSTSGGERKKKSKK